MNTWQSRLKNEQHELTKKIDKLAAFIETPDYDKLSLMDSELLRAMLCGMNHQLGRNKALYNNWPIRIAAVDGHEFFSQSASML